MHELADLIWFSARLGSDALLAQGSSGNTSVKAKGILWIKASGKWLRLAEVDDSFVPVEIEDVRALLNSGRDFRLHCPDPTGLGPDIETLRPSIETWMHAAMPHRVVVHLHAVNTVAWSVRADAEGQLGNRLNGLRWASIPYRLSGRDLGRAVLQMADARPDVLVLANHGLVVGAESFAIADSLVREVETRLRLPLRTTAAPLLGNLRRRVDLPAWGLAPTLRLHELGADAHSFRLATGGFLYPCHYLYLQRRIGRLTPTERVSERVTQHRELYGCDPLVLLSPKEGTLVNREIDEETEEQLIFLAEVIGRIGADVAVRRLSAEQVEALGSLGIRTPGGSNNSRCLTREWMTLGESQAFASVVGRSGQ